MHVRTNVTFVPVAPKKARRHYDSFFCAVQALESYATTHGLRQGALATITGDVCGIDLCVTCRPVARLTYHKALTLRDAATHALAVGGHCNTKPNEWLLAEFLACGTQSLHTSPLGCDAGA